MSDAETQQNSTSKKRRPAKWEKAFITALSMEGVVSHACAAAEIDRSTVYLQRKSYPDFAQAWEEALEIAADALEIEARRRAHDGVEEPIYYKGVLVDTVRKYSDTLMIFLLKGARPEKFRENFDHNIHGPDNGAIPIQMFENDLKRAYGDDDGSTDPAESR